MNQMIQIQQEATDKVISKAKVIATTRRIHRCESNPMIWCVQSQSETQEKKFYCVQFDQELGSFVCDCKSFTFSLKECKHIYACALKEGGYV
jgi:uncharacterized protein YpmB